MKVVLDALEMSNRETAEAYLTEKLDLPTYFGGNLDALYDCLTELKNTTVMLEHTNEGSEYFNKLLHVICAAGRNNTDLTIEIEL